MNARRIVLTCALIAGALTAPAGAHVTNSPPTLAAGSVDEITFRCPNERPNATTTKLVVQLPPAYPLRMVKVLPLPGWQISVTMRKLDEPIHTRGGDVTSVVDTIAWAGGSIAPDEYQNFTILAGPLPAGVSELPFKAVQTYSNGEVVRWIQLRAPGEAAPPNPAPVLHLH